MAADLLLNTRWMYFRYEDNRSTSDHVEVVRHQGNQVLIVTCYSTPLRSWTVPSAAIRIQPSAFFHLGHANDFAWVEVGQPVHFLGVENVHPSIPFTSHGMGTWVIEHLTRSGVIFAPSPRRLRDTVITPNHFVEWPHFLRLYRRATDAERADYRANLDRFHLVERPPNVFGEGPPAPPEPELDPEPEPELRTSPSSRRSRWEHMDDEES